MSKRVNQIADALVESGIVEIRANGDLWCKGYYLGERALSTEKDIRTLRRRVEKLEAAILRILQDETVEEI